MWQAALELLRGLRRAHLGLSYRRSFGFAGGIPGFCSRSLGYSGLRCRLCARVLLRRLLLVEVSHYARHVGPRLVIRRHAFILLDPKRPRIVSGQRLYQIEVVTLQQFPQIFRSTLDIRLRIECVRHAQLRCRSGHQLHQSLRSLRRNGPRVESALRLDHAVDQVWIQPITSARRIHHVIQTGRTRGESKRCCGCCGCPISRILCEKWELRRYSGSRKPRAGSRKFRRSLKVFDLCRWNVDETRSIRSHIEPRNVSDHLAPLVPNRKPVAQHRILPCQAGKRGDRQCRQEAET